MNMTFNKCVFFHNRLEPNQIKPIVDQTLEYENEFVGRVKITFVAYNELLMGNFDRYVMAGICKNRTILGEEPVLIDTSFIHGGYKTLNPPLDFEEKCYAFLKYLFKNGGKVSKSFEIQSSRDSAIAYADHDEFVRIVEELEERYFIKIDKVTEISRGRKMYFGLKLTSQGKEEAQKLLPKMPLYGLVSQEIMTGDIEVDDKINHARVLFFSEPQTMDKMRSACETLSYILEPIREAAKTYIGGKDVEAFFHIVNEFDIRHNNSKTKHLEHPEQLEWIFYSLLNTINTYTKLKKRLGV